MPESAGARMGLIIGTDVTVTEGSGNKERMQPSSSRKSGWTGTNALSVIVFSASEVRRRTLASALTGTQTRILKSGPLPSPADLPALLEACDVLIVDLDQDREQALEVVKTSFGFDPAITVMVYSPTADRDLLVRCMQAGAREFLSDPLSVGLIAEAFARAANRRDELNKAKRPEGKCFVFVGAKGGSGVTTLAANFAVALTFQTLQKVALVDLDLQLGDAALNLGLTNQFSTLDALQSEDRLDSELLSKLMVRHASGLQVLPAPNDCSLFQPQPADVVRLVGLLVRDFDWVVVDGGSHNGAVAQALFAGAEKVFLVTQVSVSELRNCHRMILRHFAGAGGGKLEVVLNRFAPRGGEIDEESIAKVLLGHPRWKVPSDYQAVRRAQDAATALVAKDGSISKAIFDMARSASGTGAEVEKKKFSLFRR